KESRLENARELVALQQQVQANQESAEFARRKLAELSSGTVRTERDAVIVVEKANAAAGKVRLHYLVDAASWRPQYKLRAGKQASGAGLYNTAAALDQSWELFNPEAAIKRGCALAVREGPTVAYHLTTRLTVPSRSDEQVLEVTRFDLQPDYYCKAVPILTSQ